MPPGIVGPHTGAGLRLAHVSHLLSMVRDPNPDARDATVCMLQVLWHASRTNPKASMRLLLADWKRLFLEHVAASDTLRWTRLLEASSCLDGAQQADGRKQYAIALYMIDELRKAAKSSVTYRMAYIALSDAETYLATGAADDNKDDKGKSQLERLRNWLVYGLDSEQACMAASMYMQMACLHPDRKGWVWRLFQDRASETNNPLLIRAVDALREEWLRVWTPSRSKPKPLWSYYTSLLLACRAIELLSTPASSTVIDEAPGGFEASRVLSSVTEDEWAAFQEAPRPLTLQKQWVDPLSAVGRGRAFRCVAEDVLRHAAAAPDDATYRERFETTLAVSLESKPEQRSLAPLCPLARVRAMVEQFGVQRKRNRKRKREQSAKLEPPSPGTAVADKPCSVLWFGKPCSVQVMQAANE